MDRISNLPDNMIDLILKRLVIVESVRTSVLSKSWRYRWTHLSSLNFDLSRLNFDYDLDSAQLVRSSHRGSALAYAYIVNSILSQHSGIIQELSLYFSDIDGLPTFLLFEHSIRRATTSTSLHTLRIVSQSVTLTLPSFIFSAINLRRLEIIRCHFYPPSWFNGFPNLTYFYLALMKPTAADTVSHFISICPRLEEFIFRGRVFIDQDLELVAPKLKCLQANGFFKDIAVSNAPNLESVMVYGYPGEEANNLYMCKHFDSFAHVKKIKLNHLVCKHLGRRSISLPRFGRVKELTFTMLTLHDDDELKGILGILVVSPNVEKLRLALEIDSKVAVTDPPKFESTIEKYFNDDFKHLVEVELSFIHGTKVDMKIIECLLRFSPVLELLRIKFARKVTRAVKFQFFNALLNFYRASTKVKFDVCCDL